MSKADKTFEELGYEKYTSKDKNKEKIYKKWIRNYII